MLVFGGVSKIWNLIGTWIVYKLCFGDLLRFDFYMCIYYKYVYMIWTLEVSTNSSDPGKMI